ncbi:phage minor capsid protein [Bacillus sp. OTU530]|uniref:phage minor capsid protein n=1 Tax=Bacillus sp. OTU530 TaxID=3043862 RepID=UPI00313DE80A
MPLSPEHLQRLSAPLIDIYNSIEEELLLNMARIIRQGKELLLQADDETEYQHWRLVQLNKVNNLTQQQLKTIAKYSRQTAKEIRKMVETAGYTVVEQHEWFFVQALLEGVDLIPAPPTTESQSLFNILLAYEKQAQDVFNLINTTLLKQSQQVYIDVLNKTVGKVLTGVITPQQALKQTFSDWAKRGIPALIDRGGRRWSTEAYVSTVTRSMNQKVSSEMQFARMDEYGSDLIEVSSHLGARPKCAPYQGRIFSRSGNSKRYPAWSTTSYGQPDGLLGINCGHNIYPYIQGKSRKTYEPYNKTENDKVYKESQQQRAFERAIRKEKRKLSMMEAIDNPEGIKEAKLKVREKQEQLRMFLEETGRRRRLDREQIVGG